MVPAEGDVGDEVAFLGITNSDTLEAAGQVVEETGVQYPWGHDLGGGSQRLGSPIYAGFGGTGTMPTTVFLDANGETLFRQDGQMSQQQMRDLIAEHFGVES